MFLILILYFVITTNNDFLNDEVVGNHPIKYCYYRNIICTQQDSITAGRLAGHRPPQTTATPAGPEAHPLLVGLGPGTTATGQGTGGTEAKVLIRNATFCR